MTDNTASAEVIRDLAQAAGEPSPLERGSIYAWMTGSQVHTIDLTGDKYREFPRHKTGRVTAGDVASFAQYYGKHADDWSEVFADLDAATITAVLDAHMNEADGARWQQHRLTFTMSKTPQWATWVAKDRQLMPQQAFAEFLEDNAADIAPDGPVSAAGLIELAQEFHAHTQVRFSSGKRLKDGQTQFVYTETTEAKGGPDRGTIAVPDEFHLALAPIEDCGRYRVKARFRYRLRDGDLLLGYHLDDPAGKFREAVAEVVEKTGQECDIKIMTGRPS